MLRKRDLIQINWVRSSVILTTVGRRTVAHPQSCFRCAVFCDAANSRVRTLHPTGLPSDYIIDFAPFLAQ